MLGKVPLYFPLPLRHWFQTETGKWASRDWTADEKARAQLALFKIVQVPK